MNNVCAHPLPMARPKILGCVWLMAPVQSFHHTAGKGCLDDEKIPLIRSSFGDYVKLRGCIFTIYLVQDILFYSVNWFHTHPSSPPISFQVAQSTPLRCPRNVRRQRCFCTLQRRMVWSDDPVAMDKWSGDKATEKTDLKLNIGSNHPVRWVAINHCFSISAVERLVKIDDWCGYRKLWRVKLRLGMFFHHNSGFSWKSLT